MRTAPTLPMLLLASNLLRATAESPGSVAIDALTLEAPAGTVIPPQVAEWSKVPGLTVLGQPQFVCELGKEAVLDTLAPATVKPAGLGRALTEKSGYMFMLVPERMGDRIVYRGRAEASQVHKMVNGENPGILELSKREFYFSGDAPLNTPFWLVTPASDPERRVHIRLTFQEVPAPSSPAAPEPSPAPPVAAPK